MHSFLCEHEAIHCPINPPTGIQVPSFAAQVSGMAGDCDEAAKSMLHPREVQYPPFQNVSFEVFVSSSIQIPSSGTQSFDVVQASPCVAVVLVPELIQFPFDMSQVRPGAKEQSAFDLHSAGRQMSAPKTV